MGPEITNMEHWVQMAILSRQLNMTYNTRYNVTNRERSNPMWDELVR